MKLAILGDVHGNADALRAVLADQDAKGGGDHHRQQAKTVSAGKPPAVYAAPGPPGHTVILVVNSYSREPTGDFIAGLRNSAS